jgi:hypothetical protein
MRYVVLAVILSCASSLSLVQIGAADGQIDLSPLLSGPGLAPSNGNPLQTPLAVVPLIAPASLPSFVRTDAAPIAAEEDNTEKTRSFLAISAMGSGTQRLTGEYDKIAFDLDVPPDGTVGDLIITYRNSINVLAETSLITVFREGVEIGAWQPDAPADFQNVTLPADALTPGLNRIVIRVEQSHRIFCGPEASFAIWTDIDLARSGVEVPLGNSELNIDDFRRAAAAQIAAYGTLPLIAKVAPAASFVRDLERRVSALGSDGQARLAVQSPYAVTSQTGTSEALARIAVIEFSDLSGEVALPEVRQSPQGSLVLVLSTDTTLDMHDGLLPLPAAIAGPPDLIPGQGATLETLHANGIEIRSRHRRVDVPFRLPDDWLVLTSQRAQIDLEYRYADNLPEGSLFMIKVNDTTVRLLPLYGKGGLELPELTVGFWARLLKPGYNMISFEVFIPGNPTDMICPKIDDPILEVSENTLVNVPTSPRMQLSRLSQGVQRLTPDSVALVANLAGNSRAEEILTMMAVHLVALGGERPAAEMARLTVRTFERIDQVPLDMMSINRSILERVLTPQMAELTEQAWDGAAAEDRFTQLPQRTERYGGGIAVIWQRARALAWPGDPPLADWIAGRHGQALLLMPDPNAPLDLWLIVGASADAGEVASALAAGRLDPSGPDGRAALLTADGVWQSWHPNTDAPSLNEPLTLANARAVAGNYASWSPVWFVGLLASFMSLSVLLGLSYVVSTRGTPKR